MKTRITSPPPPENPSPSICMSERSDGYSNIILLFKPRWRLIECKYGIQWIIQKRSSSTNTGVWIGKVHTTTRNVLIVSCSQLNLINGVETLQILSGLPEKISASY